MKKTSYLFRVIPTVFLGINLLLVTSGCGATSGPDKSIAGGVLGAAWGSGAGAVIGNQVNSTGPGAAIGSGIGLVGGLLSGISLDVAEGTELAQERDLAALRVHVASNQRDLARLQYALDGGGASIYSSAGNGLRLFFDADRASLRYGTAVHLERIANDIKRDPYAQAIEVHGHTDDLGDSERNMRLSEARARTVASFLVQQGISSSTLRVVAHGAAQPLASNETDAGRQLNRRVDIVVLRTQTP